MRCLLSTSPIALAAALLFLPFAAAPAHAQTAPEAASDTPVDTQSSDAPATGDQIVVSAARLFGQIDTPQPPLLELNAEDVAGYGAGSITELLQSLGPQVTSGRGRGAGGSIVLVNGVRVGSFRELGNYPPEAIAKVEVFSEEVAQRFGYSPDSRVVNIVLKPGFTSREIELEYAQPWDGGSTTLEAEGTYLRIDGPNRLNLSLEYNGTSALTEAERGVVQAARADAPALPSDPQVAAYRSLVAQSERVEARGSYTARLNDAGTDLSLNAGFERVDSIRLQGLDSAVLARGEQALLRAFDPANPLNVDRREDIYSVGAGLTGDLGDWRMTATLDAQRNDTASTIRRSADTSALLAAAANGDLALDADLSGPTASALIIPRGFDEADTVNDRATSLITARGLPLYLPGGDVSLTLDAGFDWNRIESEDTRNPGITTDLTRGIANGGFNLGVPITSTDEDFGAALGDISLNLSAGVEHYSDFGTLTDWSAGVTWGVLDAITLSATYIVREAAPSLFQLGSPEIATPNVAVFDLANNETVLATVISGGNADLPVQQQSDWKLGLVWQMPILPEATFTADYIRNHSDDVSGGLPTLTPGIEAAFPGRVTRNGEGRLLTLDQRPVSFAAQDVERLQFGLNLAGQIGGAQAGGEQRGGPSAPPPSPPPTPPVAAPPALNPEVADRLKAQFCAVAPEAMLGLFNQALAAADAGTALPAGPDGQPLALPPALLAALRGADGAVDPQRFANLRSAVCDPAPAPAPQQAQRGPGGGPPAGAGPGGGAGGIGRFIGGGNGAGRWFFNTQYTFDLANTVLIAPGVPVLDLLDGDALTGGGQPRHAVNARGGAFYKGFGLILFFNYTGASSLDGGGAADSTDLVFDDFATLGLRAFVNLGQQEAITRRLPLLQGTRLAFGLDNIFDERQRVTDSAGEVPLRYQPFLIDPVGRRFEVELRKLF